MIPAMLSSRFKIFLRVGGERCYTTESASAVTIRLYRLLQRSASKLEKRFDDGGILLQCPIEENDWGRHAMFRLSKSSDNGPNEIFQLFADVNDDMNAWYGCFQ